AAQAVEQAVTGVLGRVATQQAAEEAQEGVAGERDGTIRRAGQQEGGAQELVLVDTDNPLAGVQIARAVVVQQIALIYRLCHVAPVPMPGRSRLIYARERRIVPASPPLAPSVPRLRCRA